MTFGAVTRRGVLLKCNSFVHTVDLKHVDRYNYDEHAQQKFVAREILFFFFFLYASVEKHFFNSFEPQLHAELQFFSSLLFHCGS